MPRYIDANEVKKCSYVIAYKDEWHMTQYGEFVELADIEKAPTADVRENVHGNWSYCEKYDDYKCSACGQHSLGRYNFCPDCGAQMDERGDDE